MPEPGLPLAYTGTGEIALRRYSHARGHALNRFHDAYPAICQSRDEGCYQANGTRRNCQKLRNFARLSFPGSPSSNRLVTALKIKDPPQYLIYQPVLRFLAIDCRSTRRDEQRSKLTIFPFQEHSFCCRPI